MSIYNKQLTAAFLDATVKYTHAGAIPFDPKLMTNPSMTCLNRESEFRLDELFFSTTDRRGVIRSGNDVFVRVSGYTEDELIGHAHSCIRHPDMPRGVFRLFWRTIEAGQSIAAYVKNRAKNGSYYWVMAVATPIEDGYLSIRLKPTSEVFQTVTDVYQKVLEDENTAAADGMSKDEVAELGLASLMSQLNLLGFPDYETFLRHALTSETMARHAALANKKRTQFNRATKQSIATVAQCKNLLVKEADNLAKNSDQLGSESRVMA